MKSQMRFIFFLIVLTLQSLISAAATCTTGQIGKQRYTSGLLEFCDGAYWNPMGNTALSSCTAGQAGKVIYAASKYQYCDASNWISLKGDVGGTCSAGEAGKQRYSSSTMEFCDGSNWYNMKTCSSSLTAYTWTGAGGNSNFNNAANWSGGAVPGAGNIAKFDCNCGANCNVTLNVAVNVAGINIGSNFTGTITQATGQTVTVGASGFSQIGGTFIGNDADITITGTTGFSLTGGTFTSTSTTLKVGSNDNATMFTLGASATFNHNSGTLFITQANCTAASNYYTLSLGADVTVNHLIVGTDTNNVACTGAFTLSGSKFIVNGNLTFQRTFANGKVLLNGSGIDVKGNISSSNGVLAGSTNVTLIGTGNQTYAGQVTSYFPSLIINKTSGTVTAASTDMNVARLILQQGTFTAPTGILAISADGSSITSGSTVFEIAAGTTFTHNDGTLSFRHIRCGASGQGYNLDLQTSLTVKNLEFTTETNNAACTVTWTIAAGDTFIVDGSFSYKRTDATTNGAVVANGGTVEVKGNSTFGAGANAGTTAITFSGAGNQTLAHSAGNLMKGQWTLNKSGGTFTQTTNVTFGGAGHNLNVVNGTWDMNNLNLTAIATLNIQAGGTINKGSGTLGYTTCGGPQPCP